MIKKSILAVLFVLFTIPHTTFAVSVLCNVEIEDVSTGVKYNIEHNPKPEGVLGVDKFSFETPGNDYTCILSFFGLGNGSALACEYKGDMGYTFFMSDRSLLDENPVKNNLSFRHKDALIVIKTVCD